jgi:hypothetical protein
MGRLVGRCGYRAVLTRSLCGLMTVALLLALWPALSTARPWQVEQVSLDHADVSSPLVANLFYGSDCETEFAIVVYGGLAVTGFTIIFNGVNAITGDRAPTSIRIMGGVIGTIELVPGLINLLWPGDDKEIGVILTSLGGTALLAALLSGGRGEEPPVLVAPTSDGGAVMSMSWRF